MNEEYGWSQDLYTKCFQFAARAHEDRKEPESGLPCVVHIALVAMEVIAALSRDSSADGDLALSCALLHDILEDTDVVYDDLLEQFGKGIAEGVLALTRNKEIGKGYTEVFKAENTRIKDCLKRVLKQPREIGMVMMAERIVSLQPPPPEWGKDQINNHLTQAVAIFAHLREASLLLAARLEDKIAEYKAYC
ncbi:MAG: bifunctional (p)ppGpp synthetase/guanosine-3',5'-bis(diphosphate) 3'-pyrophosphohydrolase [Deltaproteobacteria bacterium]|nr:bifunctional (p)ppGpp synthetase/guanosine-3',5'-bis(diphosphate) 3'-pyrophosphohydrolase [Deltaproteobacteria bacterium]